MVSWSQYFEKMIGEFLTLDFHGMDKRLKHLAHHVYLLHAWGWEMSLLKFGVCAGDF